MGAFVDLKEFDLENEDLRAWDGSESPVPEPGNYVLRITGAEFGVSKKDNRMLIEDSEIVCLEDGEQTPEKGKTVRTWRVLTESKGSRMRFKNFLQATQCKLRDGTLDTDSLVGRTYAATVEHEPYTKMNDAGEEVTYQNARVTRERPAAPR